MRRVNFLPLDKLELFKPSFQVSTKIPMETKDHPIGVCMDIVFNWWTQDVWLPSTVWIAPGGSTIWGAFVENDWGDFSFAIFDHIPLDRSKI